MSRVDARAEAIVLEMRDSIRFLGQSVDGGKDSIRVAARAASLPASIIERLLYKKIKRPQADVVDPIREAVKAARAARKASEYHHQFIAEPTVEERQRCLQEKAEDIDIATRLDRIEAGLEALGAAIGRDLIVEMREQDRAFIEASDRFRRMAGEGSP